MYRYKAVLFDLDGTITDSAPGILNSVVWALKKFGIEVSDQNSLRGFMGPPLIDSFQRFYNFSYEDAAKARDLYRVKYNDGEIYHSIVYPGIREMMEELRKCGIRTALATSKPEIMAEQILDHFSLRDAFDEVVGAGMEDNVRHTKTDVILEALRRLGISDEDKERVVMVGDRKYDILGAHNCGLRSIGVSYGYADPGELEEAGAWAVCPSTEELCRRLTEEI